MQGLVDEAAIVSLSLFSNAKGLNGPKESRRCLVI